MFDTVIIGAGFAGAVLAERIATKQNKKVLLVDKRQHVGGNCYDYKDDNGIIVHKYGPHLFHSNIRQVWEYLSQFTEWDIYQHQVLACIDGKSVPIPFNLNTLHEVFPESMANRLEEKLLAEYDYNSKVPILKLKQSEDKDLQFLADFVYEKIFLHYTMKQWGMKPEEISQDQKDDLKATNDGISAQKDARKKVLAEYASGNDLIHQLIDLALLQNGMLRGEALDKFLSRSLSMIK